MPRKARIEYEGAVYHVMCRGNRSQTVFRDDRDNEQFLSTLGEVCTRCGWRVHAYVLMGNHYHILLETPEPNLVAGMQWLQGTYTKRFNVRHKEWGHLFQGRYKALLVDGSAGDSGENHTEAPDEDCNCRDIPTDWLEISKEQYDKLQLVEGVLCERSTWFWCLHLLCVWQVLILVLYLLSLA